MKNRVERLNPHTADPFDVPARRPWLDRVGVRLLAAAAVVAGGTYILVLLTRGAA